MSNVEVYIVVEGKTEQTFVRDILAPYLAPKGIYLTAMQIGKPGHKGGNITFGRVQKDIDKLLQQRPDIYISTMFDYFRIAGDWPGVVQIRQQVQQGQSLSVQDKSEILQQETSKRLRELLRAQNIEQRFIPYIEMHEFEALLFSDAEILAAKLQVPNGQIKNILSDYDSPEEINSAPDKAPSKRLEKLVTGYKKVIMGKVIAQSIGITKIRQECACFNAWVNKLEQLTVKIDEITVPL